jgi:hypothetical protein
MSSSNDEIGQFVKIQLIRCGDVFEKFLDRITGLAGFTELLPVNK